MNRFSKTDEATNHSFEIIEWGHKQGIVTSTQALDFIASNIDSLASHMEIKAMQSLLSDIPEAVPRYGEITQSAKEHVIELVSDNLSDFIDVDSAFSKVEYEDNRAAEKELVKLIEEELVELGVEFSAGDVSSILDTFDVSYELQRYFENYYEGPDREYEGPAMLAIDAIDDLFDRG